MWTRKDLKERGMYNMHHSYWRILGIILICALLTGGLRQLHIGSDTEKVKQAIIRTTTGIYQPLGSRLELKSSGEIFDVLFADKDKERLYEIAERHYKPKEGILANVYNRVIGSRSFARGIMESFNELVLKNRISTGILMLFSSGLLLLVYIFIALPLFIGKNRFILESRRYKDTKIGRILFPWYVKKGLHVAWVMFVRQVYTLLWALTIVGGVIKYYSYYMVPYILAENPGVSTKDAIKLSKDMMRGEKWKTFKLHFSFIGWYFIGSFTFGVFEMVFIKPYEETVMAELYLALREKAKKKKIENSELMFDVNLDGPMVAGSYDIDSYPLETRVSRNWIKFDYKKHYSATSMILMFFAFSIIGWLWEVGMYVYEIGEFINRGTLHGPWLPIYGSGGVLVILLLKRYGNRPGLLFLLAVILCGIVEYFTGTFLWYTKHTIWWDYSGYFLNINGRVCAEGLILFGLGGMAFVYILAPFFDKIFSKIPGKVCVVICVILLSVFCVDLIYSQFKPNTGKGITEYKNAMSSKGKIVEHAENSADIQLRKGFK